MTEQEKVRRLGAGYGRYKQDTKRLKEEVAKLKGELKLMTLERDHWKKIVLEGKEV